MPYSIPSPISANLCYPTFRGLSAGTPPESSWFPLWMLNRHLEFAWDKNPDFLFYGDIGNGEQFNYPIDTKRIFLTGENIPPNWDEADYALTHERLWTDRHWRVPLWRHFYDPENTQPMRDFSIVKSRVNKFCNFIYSNEKAKERIEFFKKLDQRKDVHSGGNVLNNIGGRVKDKLSYISQCKFTIAFENESHPGYATEKIIEPLLQGSIPIYWGDPHIEEDFNPECMINIHNFNDFDSAINKIIEIDKDDTLWEKYVSAPIFTDGKIPEKLSDEAIINFFKKTITSNRKKISSTQKIIQKLKYKLTSRRKD